MSDETINPQRTMARPQDRYGLLAGDVLMTGSQAVVRFVVDQLRADRRNGLKTGGFVSGYPGSPLGGLDGEFAGLDELGRELNIVHQPGLNEDLAATSVYGSQMVPSLPGAKVPAVLGVWYGKAPGIDRSGDAFRHGNFQGAHPLGGMLAICGDDPGAKSSSLPSTSERTLAALDMPIVFPGNPREVLEFGLAAVRMSRKSGLWVALKIVTNVADAVGSIRVRSDFGPPPIAEAEQPVYLHRPAANLAPPASLEMQRTLTGPRWDAALAIARTSGLNRIEFDGGAATYGIVAAGNMYYELREALMLLGLDDATLAWLGIRILKLGVIWPLDPDIVARFATGLDEILVIEEGDGFLEPAIKDILYDAPQRPRVGGKVRAGGGAGFARAGAIGADTIAVVVGGHVSKFERIASVEQRLKRLARPAVPALVSAAEARSPYFCSGCPHNRSTEVPLGALVGAGIGCHGMVASVVPDKGTISGLTHMGAEGAQWIGQAPFLDNPHLFQNLGDGTFAHSGSLAIRAAIAAGVHITYKLLYNRFIAMTGGQDIAGAMDVPAITRWLELEGVKRIIVTTDAPASYKGVRLSPIAEVRDRSELIAAQEALRAVGGVTVLIHDQACAAELRRMRKRGAAPSPAQRIVVNQRVCEGCGDCGQKSHCLSVQLRPTEFGNKVMIDQGSCNKDYSCIEGECPSFLTVVPAPRRKSQARRAPAPLQEPVFVAEGDVQLRLVGIGGTGVVTMAQVLGMAAVLDGKATLGLDQTGLAQKGGPVVSDLRIVRTPGAQAPQAPTGGVDVYLVFDLLTGVAPANLATADATRTAAVVSTSWMGTGRMVGNPQARALSLEAGLKAIGDVTRPGAVFALDARALSVAIFGDETMANTLLLGAAWQRGLVPLTLASIQEALRINGASVDRNLQAFEWGRTAVLQPQSLPALPKPARAADVGVHRLADEVVAQCGIPSGSELERLVRIRVPELVAYQDERYARRYAATLARVVAADKAARGVPGPVSEGVARYLYQLMAYKDEYEVARLHLDPEERARLAADFGPGATVQYLLSPPLLQMLGLRRKIALGRRFEPGFALLRALRRLRGTPFDPFGYARVRRLERALITEYETAVAQALGHLATTYDEVASLVELPQSVRGYESVKLRHATAYRTQLQQALRELAMPTSARAEAAAVAA